MNEFTNDGKYIFINTPYAEAYIPDDIFDKPTDETTNSSLAYDTGESVVTIGIFYMRFFNEEPDNEKVAREKVAVRTLSYPNKIEMRPSGKKTREVLTINGVTDSYRVYRFYRGDLLMESASKRSYLNVSMFIKLVMAGKLPRSLDYNALYFNWLRCFEINQINPGVPAVMLQAIIAKMCRVQGNPTQQFRFLAGATDADPHGYVMLSMNQVSAYSSAMSSMSFERFSEKLTTSLRMSRENLPQEPSPLEKIITI